MIAATSLRPAPRVSPPPETSPESLAALYQEHSAAVYRAAYRVTGNAADAEDVLQTVFLRLVRREDAIDLGRGAGPYLRRAAVNAALDTVRGKKRQRATAIDETVEANLADGGADPERQHRNREAKSLLSTALASLPDRTAEIFALRYFEGLGNKEIATLFKTSQTAIAVTLHRTRARLKDTLGAALGGG